MAIYVLVLLSLACFGWGFRMVVKACQEEGAACLVALAAFAACGLAVVFQSILIARGM